MLNFDQSRPFVSIWYPTKPGHGRASFSAHLDGLDSGFFLKCFSESNEAKIVSSSRQEHESLVTRCIDAIKAGQLKKVVASRIKLIDRDLTLALNDILKALVNTYPNATVYGFQLPNGEIWMGATPELLFRKRGTKIETVALAGTQALVSGRKLEEYVWGEKEIQEQRVVTDYITARLSDAGCTQVEATPAYTVQAGKLVHLKSDIRCESNLTSHQLVELLHPTPAVCGAPLDAAREFILANEMHSRAFYAGVIGVVAPNDDADLFVNLRCMQVLPTEFALYLGGGIMADSVPSLEWEETELKAMTLQNVINSVVL